MSAEALPKDAASRGRACLALTLTLTVAALIQLGLQANNDGVLAISRKWQAALFFGIVVVVAELVLLILMGRGRAVRLVASIPETERVLVRNRAVAALLITLVAAVLPLAVFGPAGRYFEGVFPRLLLFWVAVVAFSLLLRSWYPAAPWLVVALSSVVIYGLVYRLLVFVPEVSNYPFSLGWSEASRYYYASLFHAQRLYGLALRPPELHPTRYLLQSIPFLAGSLPLWFHRLWQVVLWWAMPVVVAWLLVARLRLTGALRWVATGWMILFLFQGPVYYHLLVPVALVLFGLDVHRPWRTSIWIAAASAWAGISRLNWYPVPALLAGVLYVLESEALVRRRWSILRWPAAWVVGGTAIALVSQALYIRLSGTSVDRFASSLSSDLLFYRLLPNATFAPGILPAILVASAPMAFSLWKTRASWAHKIDTPRRLLVGGTLGVLLAGGLLVSLKIGGGSNLHNLDAYLVLLLVTGSVLLFRRAPNGTPLTRPMLPRPSHLALLVGVPLVFALANGGAWRQRDATVAARSLEAIRSEAQRTARAGERVLFISQRHLLTFKMIPSVPVEPEYETVFLMEMAMSGNPAYLDDFHRLLQERAFGLIVVDRLTTALQGRAHNFGEENDAWVTQVSLPILCSYEPLLKLDEPRVDLLVPKPGPSGCPD
ncbi:MAG TPA: hypothetical protein VFI11_03440 [Anaerolineales bacterium]|nr:hypothetical protein [Anaerolineales bacterium]